MVSSIGGDIKSPDWSNEQSNEMDPKADKADPVKMSKYQMSKKVVYAKSSFD